eukprot:106791-Prymnesium_polylepis.1
MRHVAVLVRALQLPSRGLLLLGGARSGMASLAQLAALVAGVRINVTRASGDEWRRDLRGTLRAAGIEQRET